MAALDGLGGLGLIAAICALLFVEEVGVPIPFAPGDLVLAIAGIAIAGGRVNPVLMVSLALLATVSGAALGREIFALLGWERLMKLARPLHAQKPLERASEMLHRNGWRAVFAARLIPGLRVYTTQVAGVTHMRRSAFLAGLFPAAALYVGGFIGLGAAFGRPILALIHQGERQALIGALGLGLAIAVGLGTRLLLRQALVALETGGWTGPFKLRLDAIGIMVIPACLGINFAGHALAVTLNLPLFLDSVGTILAAAVGGPWVGGSVGLISNLLSSNAFDPNAAAYSVVSFALGFAAGLSRYLNWQRRASGWVMLWAVCVAISSVLSTPINLLVSGGQSGVQLGDAIYKSLNSAHVPRALAAFAAEISIDIPDKAIAVAAALLIAQALSRRPSEAAGIDLDLKEPFTFVFRSPHWLRKTVVGALCLLFSWLVIPGLLLLGYIAGLARRTRDGAADLPDWKRPWLKITDGFKLALLFVLFDLPGILLTIPAGLTSDPGVQAALPQLNRDVGGLAEFLSVLGNLAQFLAFVIQPAVWSQYLRGGMRAALNLPAVFRRVRFHLGLTMVMGALSLMLLVVALVGVIGLVVGVLLTIVYTAWVWAHLVGVYARLTDPISGTQAAGGGRSRQSFSEGDKVDREGIAGWLRSW
jgi:energy-coupling factor transport system substrate-specific component